MKDWKPLRAESFQKINDNLSKLQNREQPRHTIGQCRSKNIAILSRQQVTTVRARQPASFCDRNHCQHCLNNPISSITKASQVPQNLGETLLLRLQLPPHLIIPNKITNCWCYWFPSPSIQCLIYPNLFDPKSSMPSINKPPPWSTNIQINKINKACYSNSLHKSTKFTGFTRPMAPHPKRERRKNINPPIDKIKREHCVSPWKH